jgi:hypothetical protein
MARQGFSQHQRVAILVGIFVVAKSSACPSEPVLFESPVRYLALRPLPNKRAQSGSLALSPRPTPQTRRCDGVVLWLRLDETRLAVQSLAKEAELRMHEHHSGRRRHTQCRVAIRACELQGIPLNAEVSTVYSDLHNYTPVLPVGRKLYTPIARY